MSIKRLSSKARIFIATLVAVVSVSVYAVLVPPEPTITRIHPFYQVPVTLEYFETQVNPVTQEVKYIYKVAPTEPVYVHGMCDDYPDSCEVTATHTSGGGAESGIYFKRR